MTQPAEDQASLFAACHSGGRAAACRLRADRTVTGSTYSPDYRQRHPMVLAEGARQPRRVRQCRERPRSASARGRRRFRDRVSALRPRAAHGADAGRVRRRAWSAPDARSRPRGARDRRNSRCGYLAVSTYPVADPRAASAIRLSFQRLKAKVAGKCGLWPHDLGVSNMSGDFNNGPYWNQGCALQSNVAAQVADPVDLVRGRQEGRIDTLRRQGHRGSAPGQGPVDAIPQRREGQDQHPGRQLTALREKAGEHV